MENQVKPSATNSKEKNGITEMVKDFEQVFEWQDTTVLALEYELVRTIGERIQERLARIKQQTSEETSNTHESVDGTAEKAVGALCYLPKSIHRLATRYADDHDVTAKRFFFETMLIGLEQQGVITHEQHLAALTLPNEYGWKGRGNNSPTHQLINSKPMNSQKKMYLVTEITPKGKDEHTAEPIPDEEGNDDHAQGGVRGLATLLYQSRHAQAQSALPLHP